MSRKIRLAAELLGRGRRLLDVGCGTGAFIAATAGRFDEIVGIDADDRAVRLCTERFVGSMGIAIRHLAVEDAACLGMTFDAIACLDVIEHLDDPRPVLDQLLRMLTPGGRLVMAAPNWYNRISECFIYRRPHRKYHAHRHFHSSWGWVALLRRHGFVVQSVRCVAFPLFDFEWLARWVHLFGFCVVIVAHKEGVQSA